MSKTETDLTNSVKVQFCVPHLGTIIILAEPWTFDLYYERRNAKLIAAFQGTETPPWSSYYGEQYGKSIGKITLPEGTKLTVSRIYIRNGAKNFDSLTFWIKDCPDVRYKKKGIRFWSKLEDTNKIRCYPVNTNPEINNSFIPFITPGQRLLDI